MRTRPKKSVFFRQSDVPEVCELAGILSTLTPMSLLEKAHSFKDKSAKGISINHGLFAYPVLMVADILIYDSNVVPVGQDQKQHVEMTRYNPWNIVNFGAKRDTMAEWTNDHLCEIAGISSAAHFPGFPP